MSVARYPRMEPRSPEAVRYAERLRTLAAELAETVTLTEEARRRARAHLRRVVEHYAHMDEISKRRRDINDRLVAVSREVAGRLEGIDPPRETSNEGKEVATP